MLISGCEILAPKLLSHSQAPVRKNHCCSLRGFFFFFFWQHFCFALNYTEVKAGKDEEALLCPKPDAVSTRISPTNADG